MFTKFQLALDGVDITTSQNTPTAKTKENKNIHFECDVELQATIEKLPEGLCQTYSISEYHSVHVAVLLNQ